MTFSQPESKYNTLSQDQVLNAFCFCSGLLQLKEKDYERLNRSPIEEDGVKIVLGPGTGHGQGFLVKSKFAPCYEVYPSEGGHVEFAPRSNVDLRLVEFGKTYIETS